MAYSIIRVRELSAPDVAATEVHNARKFKEKGLKTPDNIDAEGYHTHETIGNKSMNERINERLKELGIIPRKNSVMAVEYVVALSGNPEEKKLMKKNYDMSGFLSDAMKWVTERHGGMQNLVAISKHFDESNPHAHIVVLPIVEKTVKWKNQKGSGERTENRLCARDFTGDVDKLSKLQTDFHAFVEPYGEKMGGVKFYRGTKKEEQLKEYTRNTSHELGILRAKLDSVTTEVEAMAIKLELEAKKVEFERKQGKDGRIIENHREQQKKDEKWKKDMGFKRGF
jgi:hypothetical protein